MLARLLPALGSSCDRHPSLLQPQLPTKPHDTGFMSLLRSFTLGFCGGFFVFVLHSLILCVSYEFMYGCHSTHVVRRQLTGTGLFFYRVGSKGSNSGHQA